MSKKKVTTVEVEPMTEGLPIEGTEEETEGIGEGMQISGQTADGETLPPAVQKGEYLLTGFVPAKR
ncbi:MAG: hypothetical protein H6658_02180 [Ardenticatenaceae bacterium]|nr:hypothetical protein [Ardenticatenaceae bacterium]